MSFIDPIYQIVVDYVSFSPFIVFLLGNIKDTFFFYWSDVWDLSKEHVMDLGTDAIEFLSEYQGFSLNLEDV